MKRATLYILPLFFAFACTQPETTSEDQVQEEGTTTTTPAATSTTPPAVTRTSDTAGMNLIKIIDSRPDLSIFRELLHTSYIEGIIGNDKVFTVFAPTNAAFEALPKATLEELKNPANVAKLRPIIGGHIMTGMHKTTNIIETATARQVPQQMMGGNEVVFTVKGRDLMMGDAMIIEGNIEATNGMLHIIDKVATK